MIFLVEGSMDYKQQLKKIIEFIGKHLDETLDLTQLSDMACFSKYHFLSISTKLTLFPY